MASEKPSRVTATEARVRFGEMMRRAESGETLVVERAGQPTAVIMSFEEFSKMTVDRIAEDPLEERLRRTRERYLREAKSIHYDVEDDIRQMREERADDVDSNLP